MRKIMFTKYLKYCIALLLLLSSTALIVGCKNKDSYKKEIEQKGIAYSSESFLNEAKSGKKEIIELFIKAGIDVNAKDENGITALGFASAQGNNDLTKLLIENGADVNAKSNDGMTPLCITSLRGYLQTARLLIENGADINARDNEGKTVLMFASWGKDTLDVAKLLLENGADVSAKDKEGMTALSLLAISKGDIYVAKLLIENGADINAKNNNGYTALMIASYHKENLDLVKLLIENGADVSAKDKEGYTALMIASNEGHADIADLLEKAEGADWVFIGIDKNDNEYFIDSKKINKISDSTVRAWYKEVHKKLPSKESNKLEYLLVYSEYDCKQEKMRIIQSIDYYKDGTNKIFEYQDHEMKWTYIPSDTLSEEFLKYVCKNGK